MEEAYTELYWEFLRLRSLCLKQAALLQQLTEALKRQQGTSVLDGGLGDMVSIPVQCSQVGSELLPAGPELQMAAHHGLGGPSGSVGILSDLAGGMGRLRLDVAHLGAERKEVLKATPQDPLGCNGTVALSGVPGQQADGLLSDNAKPHMFTMPGGCGSFLNTEFLSQVGGMLMSDLALQSQVCEFCHAVFPGHTTTRGEFLRHLHTHVT